jgi:hypothetical protein
MLLGEPEWYALIRLAIWMVVFAIWAGDWVLHRHISVGEGKIATNKQLSLTSCNY